MEIIGAISAETKMEKIGLTRPRGFTVVKELSSCGADGVCFGFESFTGISEARILIKVAQNVHFEAFFGLVLKDCLKNVLNEEALSSTSAVIFVQNF